VEKFGILKRHLIKKYTTDIWNMQGVVRNFRRKLVGLISDYEDKKISYKSLQKELKTAETHMGLPETEINSLELLKEKLQTNTLALDQRKSIAIGFEGQNKQGENFFSNLFCVI